MADKKTQKAYMPFVHIVIGCVIAWLFTKIPAGDSGITPLGLALVGTFLVTNYWFTTVDMIVGTLCSMVLFVLLSGTSAASVVTGTLGNTTVWQMLIVQPLIYCLKKTGATDALANWMMTRKIMYGKSALFVVIFYLLTSLITFLKVHLLVILALAEGVMKAAGYEECRKEHDAFLVGTFFAGAIASNINPFGSWIASFVSSYEQISGEPLNTTLYMVFGIVLTILLDICMVIVMKFILRCDFGKLAHIEVKKDDGSKLSKQGKFMLILFLVMILGAVVPTIFSKLAISVFLSKTLTTALWFSVCLAVCLMVRIDGQPIATPMEAFSKGVGWPMILSAAVMLYYSGIIGGADAGIKACLTGIFAGTFDGMPGIALMLVACILTIVLTGFFSNMATGVIFMSATIPLAASFGLSKLGLGIAIMWSSMPGYITPGGTGTAPYLHGMTSITKKNMFKYLFTFLLVYLVIVLIMAAIVGTIF